MVTVRINIWVENSEENEEDSDCKLESDSKSEIEESCINDADDDDSPPDLQEVSGDSENQSDNEWANNTFDDITEL